MGDLRRTSALEPAGGVEASTLCEGRTRALRGVGAILRAVRAKGGRKL